MYVSYTHIPQSVVQNNEFHNVLQTLGALSKLYFCHFQFKYARLESRVVDAKDNSNENAKSNLHEFGE